VVAKEGRYLPIRLLISTLRIIVNNHASVV